MSDTPNHHGNPAAPDDIAIIGMDCVFPSAANLRAFWANIVRGKDAIGDPPPEWGGDLYLAPASTENDRLYTTKGGFLGDLCAFDPLKHGVVPSTVDGGEADSFLALEIASRALEDAEFSRHPVPRERVAVVLGRGVSINRGIATLIQHGVFVDRVIEVLKALHPEHTEGELQQIKRQLKASLPPFNSEMIGGLISTLATGRIANRLDFQGAAYIVDAACASSHVAVQRGVEELRTRRADVAVVGGCQASTAAPNYMVFTQLSALSRRGEIRPFDKDADGTLMGEGVGILVLKRLAEAEAAGDRIYALIKAIGISSDGRGAGIMAPRIEGEALALRRAYDESGVEPETIELIEAHGTATPVGDATEIATLKEVFGGRDPTLPPVALGTVKSMIGHCLPAAGAAGLIKTALALYTKILPPTLHCENPNPEFGLDATPMYINGEARPWIHGAPWPRRAGVNAFGFGGINAHAILEEYRPRVASAARDAAATGDFPLARPSEVLLVEAATRDALIARAQAASNAIAAGTQLPLASHAKELNGALQQLPCRVGVVAASHEEAATKLAEAAKRLADPARDRIRDRRGIYASADPMRTQSRLAFMFPGEGSQYPNMLRDLCLHFPEARAWFDRVDSAFIGHDRGLLPSQAIFPPPRPKPDGGGGEDAHSDKPELTSLWRMDVGPETIFAASQAVLAVLRRLGLEPDAVVGHSTGEYSALIAAGAYRVEDEKLVADMRALNQHYQRAGEAGLIAKGWLIAVAGASGTALEALIERRDDLRLAMDNCPQQQVVCALSEASADWLEEQLAAMGALSARLPFDRAYHTPAFQPFCDRLDEYFERLQLSTPRKPLYSCVTAAPMPDDIAEIRRLAIVQWASRVRFRETIERMYADGVGVFVECAPRNNLCAFVDDILRGRPHLACPVDVEHRDGITQLNHLIAQLSAEGIPLDLSALYQHVTAGPAEAPARPLMKLHTGLQPFKLENAAALVAARPLQRVASEEPSIVPAASARHGSNGKQLANSKPNETDAFVTAPETLSVSGDTMPVVTTGSAPAMLGATPLSAADASLIDDASELLGPNETEAVLAAYLGTMDAFLRSQQSIMQAYLGGGGGGGGSSAADAFPRVTGDAIPFAPTTVETRVGTSELPIEAPVTSPPPAGAERSPALLAPERLVGMPDRFPLLHGAAVSYEGDGGQMVIRVKWDVREHCYLLDHTMGRKVAAKDAGLTALPVVPLTFSMEALAEAAALFADRPVIGMREVRGHRWIALDDGSIDLEIVLLPAAEERDPKAVRVVLRRPRAPSDDRSRPQPIYVEATVLLGDLPPAPPAAAPQHYTGQRASRWRSEDLYDAVMFHGPRLQAIPSVGLCARDGVEGMLLGMPHDRLFSWTRTPEFHTDPITTDAMGQLIGMWTMDELGDGIFPFRLERLDVFGAGLAPGEASNCRARIRLPGDKEVCSDIEVVDAAGRRRIAMAGWWDLRFAMPERFHAARAHPERVSLARVLEAWPAPEVGRVGVACAVVDDIPADFLEPSGEFWLRALSQLVLSRSERQTLRAMAGAARFGRRAEWLLGRIAAKDAVRVVLRENRDEAVYPADIVIGAEDEGRPFVSDDPSGARDLAMPHISIAHKAGRAVAAAAASNRYAGVGIDIETIEPRSDSFAEAAFSASERALVTAAAADEDQRGLMMTRIWCAKEAVGKALGWGLADILAGLEAQCCEEVVVVGVTASAAHADNPGPFEVATVRDGDFLIALVAIPATK